MEIINNIKSYFSIFFKIRRCPFCNSRLLKVPYQRWKIGTNIYNIIGTRYYCGSNYNDSQHYSYIEFVNKNKVYYIINTEKYHLSYHDNISIEIGYHGSRQLDKRFCIPYFNVTKLSLDQIDDKIKKYILFS
jgi:hypothetical protein